MTIHVSTIHKTDMGDGYTKYTPTSKFIEDVEYMHSDGMVVSIRAKSGYFSFPVADSPHFENIEASPEYY